MTKLVLKFHLIPFLFLYLFSPITYAQKDLKPKVNSEQIDQLFKDWDLDDQPGIAVGVVNNGQIEYSKGFGIANLEHNIPITSSTKFFAEAMGNQFTALAIFLLEQKGKLSLEDDIRKYVNKVPRFDQTITIQHLLSHTSGLDNYSTSKALIGWREQDMLTKKNAFDIVSRQSKLNTAPGKEYLFNDTGYLILEEIISKVSGQPFSNFIQEEIFAPLGMVNTVFLEQPGTILSNRALSYFPHEKTFQNAHLPFSDIGPSQLFTTVDDMCLWLQNYHNTKIGNATILKKLDAFATLNGNAVEKENSALTLSQYRYWDFKGINKRYLIGQGAGYNCKIIRFPDQNFGAVVLGNKGAYNGYMTSHIADLYLEKYYKTPETEEATKKVAYQKLNKKQLQDLCGVYWNPDRFFTTVISLKDDTLRYLEEEHHFACDLGAINENQFTLIHGQENETVYFENKNNQTQLVFNSYTGISLTSVPYQKDASWSKDLSGFTGVYYSERLGTAYTLIIKDKQLVATHQRLEDIPLTPILTDNFKSNNRIFNAIAFERDEQEGITGFRLSARGVKGISFKKQKNTSSTTSINYEK